MDNALYVVAIVVDPEFGGRVDDLLGRMPVWMADTEANHGAAVRVQTARVQSDTVDHTAIGALTTFAIDTDSTPESWCLGILDTVAGHHDRYSHSPGYSAVEVYGAVARFAEGARRIPTHQRDVVVRWIPREHSRWTARGIA